MAYFDDLSEYTYHGSMFYRPGTKNVGWLAAGHHFERAVPTKDFLDRLWVFCKISVAQMRGIHECEFCTSGKTYIGEWNGEKLLLGTSEIRVFSSDREIIYAAPTLIHHYVKFHNYLPPSGFVRALTEGPTPPNEEYFDRLRELALEWRKTSIPSS
jgi:hypothetical protein